MSGGEKVGGKPFEWKKSGENTSNSPSYSGSEQGSEFDLPRAGAGPTNDGSAVGKKSEHGGGGRAGDNREVSGRSQHSQQLKYYGRRNRAKQAVSVQVPEVNDIEVEGAGLVGCLAVDLTEQLESGIDPTPEQSIVKRNGSGGMASGKGTSRLERAGSSREVEMGEGLFESSKNKDILEAVAAVDTGTTVEILRTAEIVSEDNLDKTGQEDNRKNGIRNDRRGDGRGDPAVQSLEGQEAFEASLATPDARSDFDVAAGAVEKVFDDRSIGKDSTSSSSGFLTGEQGTPDADDTEFDYAGTKFSGYSDSDGKAFPEEVGLDLSSSPPSTSLSLPSNGEPDRIRKKGTGRNSSRSRRARAQSSKEGDDQSGGETSKGSEDQESSVLKGMPLEWRLALERRQYEESVLAKAEDVWAKQEILDNTKKIPSKGKEPARCKTHWDFVLEEMTWLAKDFERERKWKLSQAKKVAIRVSRSKLDVEAKGLRRQKEEEQKTRRVASNIAKDVKKFWMKVEKLVMYKHQLELEERRKKALDKHLDFLLGQTERYSTMLAENLGGEITTPLLSKAPHPVHVPTGVMSEGGEFSSVGKEIVVRSDALGSSVKPPVVQSETPAVVLEHPAEGKITFGVESVDASGANLQKDILKSDTDIVDEDFNMENEEEEDDDEATIEAEEALVTEEEQREELSALQREGELPLEELMKLYRRNGDESDLTDDSEDEEEDEDSDDHEQLNKEESEIEFGNHAGHSSGPQDVNLASSSNKAKVEVLLENGNPVDERSQVHANSRKIEISPVTLILNNTPSTAGNAAAKVHSTSEVYMEVLPNEENTSSVPREEDLALKKRILNGDVSGGALLEEPKDSLADDREYIPAALVDGSDEDDETTLEEEESLARGEAEGNADEIDRLKRESEMSIEELLAQYRSMADGSEADEDSEDIEDDFVEDRQDRTSEAGTSGSSEDDGEDGYKYLAENSAEAKERMGEPSTSGRDQWSLVSSSYGRKPKKKSIDVSETIEERKRGRLEKWTTETPGRASRGEDEIEYKQAKMQVDPQLASSENGSLGKTWDPRGSSGVSLLLGADEVVDQATAEALARVSAAAKRRGERMLKRALREEEPHVLGESGEENLVEGKTTDSIVRVDNVDGATPLIEDVKMTTNEVEEPNVQGREVGEGIRVEPSTDGTSELIASDPTATGEEKTSEDKLADAAAAAQSAQPTGYTFSTTKVRTKLPFLLKHSLREYQHIGLDWLVTMYEKRLNGILADEMGLGKTIMTISLLAHLACDRGIWGPHLIVVPTSVMLNWETEFMKWCPAFKILTYFGSAKERKLKRQGWSKPNNFHVCITTYRLVIQDAKAFKRKKWKYLILDEAHLIKNWKSQRWQTLLNFNSKRRILLTGTPLQNDLMELWSLMHFLMPHVFQSHQEFRDWFSNPITGMVEGQELLNKEVVDRLHNVLRPFLLRRLKKDVEKQLPQKYEHVIHCRLSKRQRNLYEDFMASSDTQATLSSGNFLGLINVLMQLRKVCNHPDLFEGRPIVSSFDMVGLELHLSSPVATALQYGPFLSVNLKEMNLLVSQLDLEMTTWECEEASELCTPGTLIEELSSTGEDSWHTKQGKEQLTGDGRGIIEEIQAVIRAERARQKKEKAHALIWLNMLRCKKNVLYGSDLRKCVSVEDPVHDVHKVKADPRRFLEFSSVLADIVHLPLTRLQMSMSLVESFVFAIPAARAPTPVPWCSHPPSPSGLLLPWMEGSLHETISASLEPLRPVFVRRQLFFPDRRLLQFDCGKLQELAVLLRRLKSEGHRALIFTQMTRMLDVLESFINLYGYTYMRLDGSTKPEQRQILMQRFNTNPKIFLFILSTRSGGVGINLVGADTVIFYDSDWNPAMDQQAQDRCHRIGQTREVHIYRLVSESTIEENILKKANQKRLLDDLVIQSGSYNTEFFKKLDPMELFSGMKGVKVGGGSKISGLIQTSESEGVPAVKQSEVSSADVEAALKNAEDEADYMAMKRVEQEEAAENQEFTEEGFVGNMEDEELVDDVEEGKLAVAKNQSEGVLKETLDSKLTTPDDAPQICSTLIPADAEEEMDMLADVKQMAAAAAAAGRGSISFEDQLQPVERYAMRFLELWDPRVDKASEAAQVLFEEKEWELDQLEKLKEEQEAEIDEDNEPLFYESWDTTFANEAYRQQVEVLAQQQENQRQLEWEAMEEEMRDADRAVAEAASAVVGAEHFKVKSKSLKKLKKTKFKSLKKGSLTSDDAALVKRNIHRDESYSNPQFELSSLPSRSPSQRKRKAPKLLEEEMLTEIHVKKSKKDTSKDRFSGDKIILSRRLSEFDLSVGGSDDDTRDSDVISTQAKFPTSNGTKKKSGGKISIMAVPLKKGPLIMLEKERKKDATRMQEHVPPADPWTPAEDAILCAVVHEYGGNWQLASDALAGISDGSIYRGRHRHPVHCRERFRQLLAQNATAAGDPSSDKNALSVPPSAHMKVTEEHTKRLLDVVLQLPDNEPLLQRHFAAILAAVQNNWTRDQARSDQMSLGRSKGVQIREGGDFIPVPCFSHPESSSYVISAKRAFCSAEPLVREALASVGLDEETTEGSKDVVASRSEMQDEQVPVEIQSDDGEENIMDYLDSDATSSLTTSDQGLDMQLSQYPSLILSEELFGFTTTATPIRVPANVLRDVAESTAEQRFRSATNSGWGPGVYEWAGAALSGLGCVSMPSKAKSKKRPAQADAGKSSKPKQPRIPKVSKKVPADNSVPLPAEDPGAIKGSPALVGGAQNSGSLPPQPSLNEDVPADKEANSGESMQIRPTGQNDPGDKVPEKKTPVKGITSGGVSSKKERKRAVKKPTGGPSTIDVVDDTDVVRVVPRSFREVSPLADVETLSPDIGSAFDDLSESGSDDEVVITGVSLPPAGRSDLGSQVPSSVKKPKPQAKNDRGPLTYMPVERLQSDKSGNSRIKDGGSLGPKGTKQKLWPENSNFSRFPQNIQLEVPVSVSGWVPKASGDTLGISQSSRAEVLPVAVIPVIANKISSSPQRSKKGAGRPSVASTSGIEHVSPASSRPVQESPPFVPWAPPVGIWPTSASPFQSISTPPDPRSRNSSDLLKRSPVNMPNVPSLGHLKVPPFGHLRRNLYEASTVGHGAGQSSSKASLPFTSSNLPAAPDNYVIVKAASSNFLQHESEEDPLNTIPSLRVKLGQVPAPYSVGSIQDRSSNLDSLEDSQFRSPLTCASSGFVQPRQSPSKRPSLFNSSPRFSHTELEASYLNSPQSVASQRESSSGPDLCLSLGRSATVRKSPGSSNHESAPPNS
ncbi:helicase SRCAP/SWR1 [Marchantia polymorpha subsp. ruderalis]|uniref:DNA helicase n=4 Tax=Marchantia polymorpha TaxID=3197 RepID=A0AAF6C020_MARPO|nr:hypothetical protein MARPO_0111s0052 [Marchantia polymorpha]BBN17604.1 hypothetical protein Mp_7g15670 [Marchantia polymorpha subsp. ruderalis]|eukprot:PTQ31497.1 hypothetical protein MARPO_0111s0052 [Marchantia polymorpha]